MDGIHQDYEHMEMTFCFAPTSLTQQILDFQGWFKK